MMCSEIVCACVCVSVLTYVLNVCECTSMHRTLHKHTEVRGGYGLYSSLALYSLETWSLLELVTQCLLFCILTANEL